ncbi:MAG: hypothetical protein K0R65_790 [Crocinitomicaceae bacterium]|nr:hypothetical protein [Crocinitomicaceae bacterium]
MKILYKLFFISILASCILVSCNEGEKADEENMIDEEVLDPNSSLNTNFDGKIFSIPSPVQTSMLIKEAKLPYTENLLNSTENIGLYTTESKRALNLGVYGTDLGYVTLYNQNATSLKYLKAVEKLTSELKLESAFDKDFMTRFEKNNTNQDSMVKIVSDAFRKADNFLKNNDRKNTSVLILTGGWIESLYLACELNRNFSNMQITNRIGEQQETLNTIIEILDLYNKNGVNDEILSSLEDLKLSFDKITIEYDYVAPKTDASKKLTTLQHKTKVKMDSNVLNMITMKINTLRDKITL